MNTQDASQTRSKTIHSRAEADALFRRIKLRIIPFLFIVYIFNQLDRINISFARLQFLADVGLSDAAYGFGAGLFFIGYILFEVPSNLYMQKVGARATFMRIMVLWGLISAGMSLVSTPMQFYVMRFLLGAAEAGFFPGLILYLTYWFPSRHRAQVTSLFIMGIAAAGVFGSPVSGFIMTAFSGVWGYAGWQWLFVIEGLPSVCLAVVAWFYLSDRPAQAKWLSEHEKDIVEHELEADMQLKSGREHHSFLVVLRDPRIFVFSFIYFTIICSTNAITLWMPAAIQSLGIASLSLIGVLSALPYLASAIGMFFIGKSSDRSLERRWHTTGSMMATAGSFILLALVPTHPIVIIALFAIAAAGVYSAVTIFWAIPPAYLGSLGAAGGIGLISSLGGLGGFVSPIVIGWVTTMTGSTYDGFAVIGLVLGVGCFALLLGVPQKIVQERQGE